MRGFNTSAKKLAKEIEHGFKCYREEMNSEYVGGEVIIGRVSYMLDYGRVPAHMNETVHLRNLKGSEKRKLKRALKRAKSWELIIDEVYICKEDVKHLQMLEDAVLILLKNGIYVAVYQDWDAYNCCMYFRTDWFDKKASNRIKKIINKKLSTGTNGKWNIHDMIQYAYDISNFHVTSYKKYRKNLKKEGDVVEE